MGEKPRNLSRCEMFQVDANEDHSTTISASFYYFDIAASLSFMNFICAPLKNFNEFNHGLI